MCKHIEEGSLVLVALEEREERPEILVITTFLFYPLSIGILVYDSLSDVGESRVWFASKNLTPCRMHLNDFLIAQIIAKCHSFPNMYDML